MKFPRQTLLFFALGWLASACPAQPRAAAAPLRALIVGGGPGLENNQYAIESNARFLEKLTAQARWRRVLFADGKAGSRTIATLQETPDFRARRALAWILDEEIPEAPLAAQAPTLARIDGSATRPALDAMLRAFARPAAGERGLLYFTGHGSAGQGSDMLGRARPDFQNTTYALWDGDDFSTRELARSIKNWPAKNPLVVVMVQCHSGGFANLIFQDGDPLHSVVDRDIAGFFSSTGQRMAAGCTSEVNERNYQDFTTHFFAALSGVARDGRRVTGADYDRNGAVSMSEAFAWANVHDLSIDVPVSTSDTYLRALYPRQNDDWQQTPYSQILANAQPWQKAMLSEISQNLGLKGETRIAQAIGAHEKAQARTENDEPLSQAQEAALLGRIEQRMTQLRVKFPGLGAPRSSAKFRRAKRQALDYLAKNPAQVAAFDDALQTYQRAYGAADVREAMLERFVRASYTVALQTQLRQSGTPQQRAIFARLRNSEGRNPLS